MEERELEPAQKWMWGLIRRLNRPFSYTTLQEESPWRQLFRLDMILWGLSRKGWLEGNDSSPKVRRRVYERVAVNPYTRRREAERKHLQEGLDAARETSDETLAKFILAHLVLNLADGCMVLCDASVDAFSLVKTGERLCFDVYLPKHKVALDLQRPERDEPPEGAVLTEEEHLRRYVATHKADLCAQLGIQLLQIPPTALRSDQLSQLLAGKVPLKQDLREVAHLCSVLDQAAAGLGQSATLSVSN